MKKAIKYIVFILLVVFTSCENREWDNPFDPDCPKELFTPANFTAKQEGNLVKLTWTQSNTQISGFIIERSVDGGAWSSVATPEKTELTWSDPNITGGKEHKYRLVAKAGSNKSNEVTAQVTPVFASALITKPLTKLLSTSAVIGGEITSDGGSPVTARGVCWSTSPNPTISNSKTSDGTGTGTFTSTITELSTVTTYYARAYATTSVGTSYGNEISFKTFFGEVTDIEGNVYPTVKIGEQVWMAKNLKTTKYNDGTLIPNVMDNTTWAGLTTGAFCWYDNDATSYKNIYGALYNWYTVNTGKLAPIGWHVPTDAEWTTLTTFLGGENIAGGKLKEFGTTHWQSPNTDATNESGFTALAGGYRGSGGSFPNFGASAFWWSSSEYSTTNAPNRYLMYNNGIVYKNSYGKTNGFSVRCILGTISTPTISTTAVTNKTATSATSGGNITGDGGAPITSRGVCWSTSPNPTTANSKTTDGTGTGNFTSNITGLTANTTYYLRAYATNSQGTAYGAQESFTTPSTSAQTVTDIDGNVYNSITIGTQVWMAENLKVTKYNDGTTVPLVTDSTAWSNLITPGYCWYDNNATAYKITFGALYNWYALNSGKLCPAGWHIPTYGEWTTLIAYLGGEGIAGGKMKETGTTHWASPNTGATNTSGFSVLPGGYRSYNGTFGNIGYYGYWWSSTENSTLNAWYLVLFYDTSSVYRVYFGKDNGFSVRCVRD